MPTPRWAMAAGRATVAGNVRHSGATLDRNAPDDPAALRRWSRWLLECAQRRRAPLLPAESDPGRWLAAPVRAALRSPAMSPWGARHAVRAVSATRRAPVATGLRPTDSLRLPGADRHRAACRTPRGA